MTTHGFHQEMERLCCNTSDKYMTIKLLLNSHFPQKIKMTLKNTKITNKKGEKKVSWTQTGEDAIYLYKLLHKQNNEVDFKEFIKTHQNWE